MKISLKRARDLLQQAKKTRVIVFGDLILDEFIYGNVNRISPEAPVPVLCVEKEAPMPGGAANVAGNIVSLGGAAYLVGVVGEDDAGRRLKHLLDQHGMEISGIANDPSRPTTIKTRIIAHRQQVVRIDREKVAPLSHRMAEECLGAVEDQLKIAQGVIIEDYGKGTITSPLLQSVIRAAKKMRRVIAVDPKEEHIHYYRGVTALTPNRAEAAQAARVPITDEASLVKAGRRLMQKLKPEALLITLGEDGMRLFEKSGRMTRIPTVAREVFDVSGAGDTVIATFTLLKSAGASTVEAAQLANAAAGVVVAKVGTATCTPDELLKQLFNSGTVSGSAGFARAKGGSTSFYG
ncbi:MAG: D-glycero-beta-D-manno-heptose-7-phosphate kinase [Candidatus Omnitrophica bacterium]|nr:D-glycero-beta-D-manno-heptose-7-phosphate kinase [Candidatus Omnitrophota bacterium]